MATGLFSTPQPGATTGLFGSPSLGPTPSAGITFGAPATTTTTGTTGLFGGSSAKVAATGSGLFGSSSTATPPSSTAGLFPATSLQAQTGGLFGAATSASAQSASTGGLFSSPAATSAGGLFGPKPTTFTSQTPGTLSSTPFGAPQAATALASQVGLGGSPLSSHHATSAFGLATNATGASQTPAVDNPKEGEVPRVLVELVEKLKIQLRDNRVIFDSLASANATCDGILTMDRQLHEISRICVLIANDARKMHANAQFEADLARDDLRVAELLQRRCETPGKSHGSAGQTNQIMSYLHALAAHYEEFVRVYREKLGRIEQLINARLRARDEDRDATSECTEEELMRHLRRFDESFKCIASQVFQTKAIIQDMKEIFLDSHRRLKGPYADNPFSKQTARTGQSLSTDLLKGADAFPSQTSLLRLGQALSKSVPPTAPSTMPTFGASSSLFGATKPTSSTFSFAPASSTATPFFKPFATPTSITATTAAPSLFGSPAPPPPTATAAPTPAVTQSMPFSFGNTLNTASSGTLFGGSAKPFGK